MKNIIIIVCILIITFFSIPIQNEVSQNPLDDFNIIDTKNLDNVLASFTNTDKVVKNSISFLTIVFSNCTTKNHHIDSFFSILKINGMLMTIKYGSTLINLS